MSDYQQAKIYSIFSPHTDKVYIGSTTRPLSCRFKGHKNEYISYMNGTRDTASSSFELFNLGDCDISLIEEYPCEDITELRKREGKEPEPEQKKSNMDGIKRTMKLITI